MTTVARMALFADLRWAVSRAYCEIETLVTEPVLELMLAGTPASAVQVDTSCAGWLRLDGRHKGRKFRGVYTYSIHKNLANCPDHPQIPW
jgi:hypothetical protein